MSIQELYKALREKDLYPDLSELDNGVIVASVEWGDWKHDHSYCDHLMRECGYVCTDEQVTEEDGSDCYSAIHFYEPIK